jgi:menaquinone-9 beta-reductase
MNQRERTQSASRDSETDAQPKPKQFDVIVAGAGLAGCTAARLFALEGLQVGLVESHGDMRTFKQLCTHFIQASATPTLRRMRLDASLSARAACVMG